MSDQASHRPPSGDLPPANPSPPLPSVPGARLFRPLAEALTGGLVAGALLIFLLERSPGRLGSGLQDVSQGSSSLLALLTSSWSDGRPVASLVLPAFLLTLGHVLPALGLLLFLARKLALATSPRGALLRRALAAGGLIPLFLLGYAVILGLNQGLAGLIGLGLPRPAFFALPMGDGEQHLFTSGVAILVLTGGDGLLTLASQRLRLQVRELEARPFVLAAEVNGGSGARAIRRHLHAPLRRVAVALLPLLLGSAVVLESQFMLPGVGRLLVERLDERDLPVVGGILLACLGFTLLTRWVADLWAEEP